MERGEDLFRRFEHERVSLVHKFIEDEYAEELYLDYKCSATEDGSRKLHSNDWASLAKAISGFGNSEGGIIVWGVDCRKNEKGADIPAKSVPIVNVSAFVTSLNDAVSGCNIPPHTLVQTLALIEDRSTDSGFAITYVPKSNHAPHRAVHGKQHYFIRAGSAFTQVPHGVLAGMFGRRPNPALQLRIRRSEGSWSHDHVIIKASLQIENVGSTMARDVFFTVGARSEEAGAEAFMKLEFEKIETQVWQHHLPSSSALNGHSKPGMVLDPGVTWRATVFRVDFDLGKLRVPTHGLVLTVIYGCDGMAPERVTFRKEGDALSRWVQKILDEWKLSGKTRKIANQHLLAEKVRPYEESFFDFLAT